MKHRFILIGLLITLLAACTEQVDITPYDFPKVFTGESSRSWKLRSLQLIREGKGAVPLTVRACEADDIYTFYFNSDRRYTVSNGASKCSDSEPDDLVDSNWGFINSTSTLTIMMPLFGDGDIPFTLKEADDTKMTIDIYVDEAKTAAYRVNLRVTSGE